MMTASSKATRPEDVLWNSIDKDMKMALGRLSISVEMWQKRYDEFCKQSALEENPHDVSATILFLDQFNQIDKWKEKAAVEYLAIAYGRYKLRNHVFSLWKEENEELLFAAKTKMIVAFAISALNMQSEAMRRDKENGGGGGVLKAVNNLTRPLKVWAVKIARSYPSDMAAAAIARDIYPNKVPAHLRNVRADDPERIIADAIRAERKSTARG